MRASVVASTDAVASSRIRMRGSTASARAIATRCRCPPESVMPRSPITVSYPFGSRSMNSCACAARAARSTSSCERPPRPKAMFSRTLAEKRKGSWAITPTSRRSDVSVTSRTSTPSTVTRPPVGWYSRARSLTRVVLPAPLAPTIASERPASISRSSSVKTGSDPCG